MRRYRYEFIPVTACDMCGSTRARAVGQRLNRTQGGNPRESVGLATGVKRCLDCDLIYTDPRPKPYDLSDHYGVDPDAYWVAEEPAADYFADEIATARRLLGEPDRVKVLDIGAGTGIAMATMQRADMDAFGIEPGEMFRARAIARGIRPDAIQLAGVEDAAYPAASFDFINFGVVLEHLQEPAKALERAMTWLRPGGVMRVCVPSSNHLVARLANVFFTLRGTNYTVNTSPMHPPYHLYEFGERSFEAHAGRAGYEIVQRRYNVCSVRHFPRILHPLLAWIMARTKTGMEIDLWLRKSA